LDSFYGIVGGIVLVNYTFYLSMARANYNVKKGQVGVECPQCERDGDSVGSGFDKERVEAWLADSDSDVEFDYPQANVYKTFPTHEPCGNTMIVREEDRDELDNY
jgi:hypothetical protein